MKNMSGSSQIKTVEEYINSFPKEMRNTLQTLRKAIKDEVPDAEETISYKMPAIKLKGKSVVYFAAWKDHISMYPFSVEMEKFIPEASEYKTSGKGTIQFPNNKPLPLSVIKQIVRLLVEWG